MNETLAAIIRRLAAASWKEREAIKAELAAAAEAMPRAAATEALEELKKGLELEVRWEVDEVIEGLKPPPVEEKKEEPPPEEGGQRKLRQSDLQLIYDDPRGIRVHKTKKPPELWFLTQVDPYSGQPQMMQLHPQEVAQVRQQLKGSPYWVPGSGES